MIRAEWEWQKGVPPSPRLDWAHAPLPLGSPTAEPGRGKSRGKTQVETRLKLPTGGIAAHLQRAPETKKGREGRQAERSRGTSASPTATEGRSCATRTKQHNRKQFRLLSKIRLGVY